MSVKENIAKFKGIGLQYNTQLGPQGTANTREVGRLGAGTSVAAAAAIAKQQARPAAAAAPIPVPVVVVAPAPRPAETSRILDNSVLRNRANPPHRTPSGIPVHISRKDLVEEAPVAHVAKRNTYQLTCCCAAVAVVAVAILSSFVAWYLQNNDQQA